MKSTSSDSRHSPFMDSADYNCPEIDVTYLAEIISCSYEAEPLTVSVAGLEFLHLAQHKAIAAFSTSQGPQFGSISLVEIANCAN